MSDLILSQAVEIERLTAENERLLAKQDYKALFNGQRVVVESLQAQLTQANAVLQAMRHDAIKYPQLRLPDMQRDRLDKALAAVEAQYHKPVSDEEEAAIDAAVEEKDG